LATVRWLFFGQNGDDRARARLLALCAFGDQSPEHPAHAREIGQASLDDRQLLLGK
jgi:hypothetical protein